jgi:TATA-binding protein-associated factor Taf7
LEVDDDSEPEEDADEDESLSESDDDDSSEDEEDVEELEVEDGVAVLFGSCRTTRDISSAAKVIPSSRFLFFPTRGLGLYLILRRVFTILLG